MAKSKDPNDYFAVAHSEVTRLLNEMKGFQDVRPTVDPFQEPGYTKAAFIPPKYVKKSTKTTNISPVTTYVRSLEGGPFITAQEVADELKISVQAVRKYAKLPKDILNAPSNYVPFGRLVIYLYTREDVEEIRVFLLKRRVVMPNMGNRKSNEA